MTPAAICQALLMVRGVTDPFSSFVRSLVHFDGSLADTIVPTANWALGSGAVINTTPGDPLTGSGCLDCVAGTTSRVTASGTMFDVSTSDFCVEFWFYDTDEGTKNQTLFTCQSVSTAQTVRIYGSASATIMADISGVGPVGPEVAYSLDTWTHVAITRSGSNWTFWVNGAVGKTWTNGTFDGGTSSTNVWLGAGSSAGSGRQCRIDEFRLSVGTPRYTTAFTPIFPFPNP